MTSAESRLAPFKGDRNDNKEEGEWRMTDAISWQDNVAGLSGAFHSFLEDFSIFSPSQNGPAASLHEEMMAVNTSQYT